MEEKEYLTKEMACNTEASSEKVRCPGCGEAVEKKKYCNICGSPLSEAGPATTQETNEHSKSPEKSIDKLLDLDFLKNLELTMIAELCLRPAAGMYGDSYSKVVLYRNKTTGEYSIHKIKKNGSSPSESTEYGAKPGAEAAVFELIDKLGLPGYEGKQGLGLGMGSGEYILSFLRDGKTHHISSYNLMPNEIGKLIEVGDLINSFIKKD
ncbi:MAG: hypothetical protein Q4B67_03910 [Eubacteriales bacterium]|nr:hypothetical protein [Eubacteriales bacterium]